MSTLEAEARRWLEYARSDLGARAEHPDLASLSVWAVEARYPGDSPGAVEADARTAAQQARAVWETICADLTEHGLDTTTNSQAV